VTTLEFNQAMPPRSRAALARLLRSSLSEGERRLLNVIVAACGLVVTAPLMLGVAVLVKLTSRGPVFFTQTRVGLDRRTPKVLDGNGQRHTDYGGKPFTIFKFRTMAVSGGGAVWAHPDDPRVTRVGRVLRKYRLDELPQLLNVLRGDMNVVGPRPEQLAIFASLRERIEGYELRQRVRPGITGWAQINQSYDRCLDDVRRKVLYDLEYLGRQSVSEDLKIMLRTVPVMLLRRGGW
jgi:lipopolysaccharide/colanic/teichoic acid biosynthesis glycosyltransferase